MDNILKKQAEEIRKMAEESGVQSNFLFVTTFDRYLFLIDTMEALKAEIKEEGLTVKKAYVKGVKNVYSSPSVRSYNSTCDLANKTVATLLKIIRNFNVNDGADEEDPLLSLINGSDDNAE